MPTVNYPYYQVNATDGFNSAVVVLEILVNDTNVVPQDVVDAVKATLLEVSGITSAQSELHEIVTTTV